MAFATLLTEIVRSSASQQNILTDGQFTFTYDQLPVLMTALADFWAQQGVGRDICLGVECPNSAPGALTLLSLFQQEFSFVLLPPSEQGEAASEWKPLPRFCHYRLVVKRAPADAPAEWGTSPAHFLQLEANPTYQPPVDPAVHLPGQLFLRTSGSMGASKLVVHQQAKLVRNAHNCVEKYHFTAADRAVIPVPIAHMYGLGAEFLPAVLAGAAIDLQDRTNLLKYLEREKRFQPTIAFVTPTICDMLLKGFRRPRTTYKVIVTSGQRISETLFRAFDEQVSGCLVNQYGSSEMGAIAACDPGDPCDLKATTIGRPMAGVQLTIMERSDGVIAGDEGVGELHCCHPFGFTGYVNEDGGWLYQSAPEQWYSTGDLAQQLNDGSIQVVGRAGNSVNRRGYLVQFADIERQMEKLAAIAHVVVVRGAAAPQQENKQGERIVAFCVLNPAATITAEQLRQACFDLLPAYAIPDDVCLVEGLPLLPSGKVDRQALMAKTREHRNESEQVAA